MFDPEDEASRPEEFKESAGSEGAEEETDAESALEQPGEAGELLAAVPLSQLYQHGFPPQALLRPLPLPAAEEEDLGAFLVEFFERVLARDPCHLRALTILAEAYTALGRHPEGLRLDLRLRELKPGDPTVLYNLACSYSLAGRVEEALAALAEAIRCGYRERAHLEQDRDLANIRQDPRYQELLRTLSRAARPPRAPSRQKIKE